MKISGADGDALAGAIGRAEEHTSAELVLVVAQRSGSYRDTDLALGGACALAALTWASLTHVELPHLAAPSVTAAAGFAGAALASLLGPVRRLLTTRARREAQALDAARLAFLAEGVDRTSGRTGVLVHVSLLERRVTLVGDRAVEALGPAVLEPARARLQAALDGPAPAQALALALEALGKELGAHLPRLEGDVDELPNAPREAAQA